MDSGTLSIIFCFLDSLESILYTCLLDLAVLSWLARELQLPVSLSVYISELELTKEELHKIGRQTWTYYFQKPL